MQLPRGINLRFLTEQPFFARHRKYIIPISAIFVLAGVAAGTYTWRHSGNVAGELASNTECGIPSDWLQKYFKSNDLNQEGVGGCGGDPDDDILTNNQEYLYGTDPTTSDSDGDGQIDSYEVAFGQNPNGEGLWSATPQSRDYINEFISSDEDYEKFSFDNILGEVNKMFEPDRAVVLDLPKDSDLLITKKNDVKGMEEYFNATKETLIGNRDEAERVSNNLLSGEIVNQNELIKALGTLQSYVELLLKTPVPSELATVHKLKIAGFRAGIRMYEIIRDEYTPGGDNSQFYKDFFYQAMASQQATNMELAAWQGIGEKLQAMGGM